jgi:hypothetical protein
VPERNREAADRRGDIGSEGLGGGKANQVFHWRKLYQAGLLGTVMFGTNAEFDAVSHLIGTAVGWGRQSAIRCALPERVSEVE